MARSSGQEQVRRPGMVALTFDDGPDPVWTPQVLAALEEVGATATFFVITRRAAAYPGILEDIQAGGHRVELHCARHLRHTELTRVEVERDTREALATLVDLGVQPRRWRTPWGVSAPWTGEVAATHGLELTGWSADSEDWRGDPAGEMLDRLATQLAPGVVVLLHDGLGPGARRPGCAPTVALIEPLVELARSRGLVPAPLGAPSGGQ